MAAVAAATATATSVKSKAHHTKAADARTLAEEMVGEAQRTCCVPPEERGTATTAPYP